MGKKAVKGTTQNLLTVREVLNAKAGQHSDGAGLTLRVSDDGNASWVYRFTAPSGRRREMGLGKALRGTLEQAGQTLRKARDAVFEADILLHRGLDPLAERDKNREAAKEAEQARKVERDRERWTLARAARDYHERVIERTRTPKHAAQWIASLENHMPPALWHSPIEDIERQREEVDYLRGACIMRTDIRTRLAELERKNERSMPLESVPSFFLPHPEDDSEAARLERERIEREVAERKRQGRLSIVFSVLDARA